MRQANEFKNELVIKRLKRTRSTFNELNLIRKRHELCDVVINVGTRKIFAHRVILAACSPYFRAMFTGELTESRQSEITIRDMDETGLATYSMFLQFGFCKEESLICLVGKSMTHHRGNDKQFSSVLPNLVSDRTLEVLMRCFRTQSNVLRRCGDN